MPLTNADFIEQVWDYYHKHGRDLPWRTPDSDNSFDAYKIMVSEVMLQQTQAARVIPKYLAFLEQFPSAASLANAPLSEVLTAWSGLGYNRRARFLWQAAQQLQQAVPGAVEEWAALPGIGSNTAGAIVAYSYNQPVVFIETNIRTVYLHHFFTGQDNVRDAEILPRVAETLDREHPREWYWALMDYGSYIKQTVGNASRSSAHYTKQSRFIGSQRQIRGAVLRELITGAKSLSDLQQAIGDDRLAKVLESLTKEQLIRKQGDTYLL